jgi:protein-tyrosine phosphatase
MFVCHGNVGHSTMAEFVMKDLVQKEDLADKFIINSSATSREKIGCDTHYGTKEKLREKGIPYTKRKAVQIYNW